MPAVPPTYLHRSAAPSGSQPPAGVGREAPLTAARRGAISLGRLAGRRSANPGGSGSGKGVDR